MNDFLFYAALSVVCFAVGYYGAAFIDWVASGRKVQ